MKVVLGERCWVRCRRPPAEYLLPLPCRRIVRALDSRCGENDGRKMKRPCGGTQGNRILIDFILAPNHHPEPVEGLSPLPIILSLSKD